MRNAKRMLSVLLAVVAVFGCFVVTAHAGSESYTGVYNGKNYYTSLLGSGVDYSAYMSYTGSSRLRLDGNSTIVDKEDRSIIRGTGYLYKEGYKSISDAGSCIDDYVISSARCQYFIANYNIHNLWV